jgi:phage N-6-adenine-methyltransferase
VTSQVAFLGAARALAKVMRAMAMRALLTSQTTEWATLPELFAALQFEFQFSLDPCSTHANAKCHLHFTKREDGLKQDWLAHTVFMNPPYGRDIGAWMKKAHQAAQMGATCVCLVPARTDKSWWHGYAMKGEIRFTRGRIKFQGGRHPAPFPSAIVIFRPRGHVLDSYSSTLAVDSATSSVHACAPDQPSTFVTKSRRGIKPTVV